MHEINVNLSDSSNKNIAYNHLYSISFGLNLTHFDPNNN